METLPRNLADNAAYPNAVFVVLDYADSRVLRDWLQDRHASDIACGRLVVYHYFGEDRRFRDGPMPISFHMAHAKNMVMRCGIREGADVLVTLDADNFTGPGFAQWIADAIQPDVFLCPNFRYINSMPHGPDRPPRGFAGRLAIRSQDFIKAGGYDQVYSTWHGEDFDLIFRLRRIGYDSYPIPNRFLNAIRHGANERFKEYPHAEQYETDSARIVGEMESRAETVVNYGNFGVGGVYRNFASSWSLLARIPTRIFGIGMHRTGTTSLHRALEMLGFDSFHWRTGNESRLIWEEMNAAERSKTLERWYALSDLPIPLLYQRLDKAYPGSKFILTLRDEAAWIRSVERLWSYVYNPNRWEWDVYPFSNRIHKVLYGRTDFDKETMLNRYRAHNAEVRQYFAGRDDFLVMDMSVRGDLWNPLCKFLDMSVPAALYPMENHLKNGAAS